MNNNDQVEKKMELVIDALAYAHKNNLDIKAEADVQKILDALDSNHIFITDIAEFMKMLQVTNDFIEEDVKSREGIS